MFKLDVLVTGVGSTTAQSVLKGIRRQSVYETRVVGTDTHCANEVAGSAFCDAFHTVPPASNRSEYVDRLLEVVDTEGVDVVVPIVDPELPVVAEERENFPSECRVLVSDPEVIDICNDKYRSYEWLRDSGFRTPDTWLDPGVETVRELVGPDSSVVVKPRRGVSSRDVYEITHPDEAVLLNRVTEPIVQPKVDGTEYTVDVYHIDGESVAVPRERTETRAGISYTGRTVDDDHLTETASRVIEELGVRGPANVQCFRTEDETIVFEINPRFSGSLPLTIEAGANTPLYALHWAARDSFEFPDEFGEVTMHRFWNEVFRSGGETTTSELPQS